MLFFLPKKLNAKLFELFNSIVNTKNIFINYNVYDMIGEFSKKININLFIFFINLDFKVFECIFKTPNQI